MSEKATIEKKTQVTVLFAGDSGDGMQLTGTQFTNTNALYGNDVSTFPNFPAEIRAPQGTLSGVSGFQLQFGSNEIYTPGDAVDLLVAMNAAGLLSNLHKVKKGGTILANTSGFDAKNLRLAKAEDNPLTSGLLQEYRVIEIDISKLTKEALKDTGLTIKEAERSKNMFVLGFLYWLYNRELTATIRFLEKKFANKLQVLEANIKVLKAGYNYGDATNVFTERYEVEKARLLPGEYRNITGNAATAIGMIAAAHQAKLDLFYGSYPITPASDILHELSKRKNFNVKTFQAEDEIAAVSSAIGASFGGALGYTGSSGPGIALKTEAIGLAVMLELPLVVINVQRGGPSTGLPTKTEQADLFQAIYGRNGEAPLPVIAAKTPADCFYAVYEASRIAVEYMTPIIFLSDGYLANGSEPWRFPKVETLNTITPGWAAASDLDNDRFYPYRLDDRWVRKWAVPGMKNFEHRVGGLEKEKDTGNVSYSPENHEEMVKIRQAKIDNIANDIPLQTIDTGKESGKVLVVGWGSTYGAIKTAVSECIAEGMDVSQAHITYLNPLPANLKEIFSRFDKVLVPEMNNGQLIHILRDKFLLPAIPLNKIQGVPFTVNEVKQKIKTIYND